MKIRRSMTLDAATKMVDGALKLALDVGLNPICVVVLDSGACPVVFKSQDGCGVMRYGVAMGKAFGALGMGTSGRDLRDRLERRPNFASALAAVSRGQFVPNPGGVLIVDDEGMGIGAVGISGDTSEKDEYCAIRAIQDAGYQSNPTEPDRNWRG